MKLLLQRAWFYPAIAIIFQLVIAGPTLAESKEVLRIQTQSAEVLLRIDAAVTPEELERGLMGRKHIPQDYGMLFWFGQPIIVSMWMKDTPSALDMLFIDSSGKITAIKENTTPYSEEIITDNTPAIAVLEMAGGSAKHFGIRAGDKVKHPRFSHEKNS